jgi:hypothetical protein
MYFRCGFILDFKWQGVFLKIKRWCKNKKREKRPNSGAQISEPTLPENLFSKENTWRRKVKKI